MHGLGNDFAIVDRRRTGVELTPQLIARLADRRRGIGFDQLLAVEAGEAGRPAYQVFNADGSVAGQCGNGARCLARWLMDRGEIGAEATLEGPRGPVRVSRGEDEILHVAMGAPRLVPAAIPFDGPEAPAPASLAWAGRSLAFRSVSMGNPHAVMDVAELADADPAEVAAALQADARFPDSVNVGFVRVLGADRVELRVFERGVGETPACGSGACAAVVVGRLLGRLGEDVAVSLPGGTLRIRWAGGRAPVLMSGPAEYAFEGEFDHE